MALGVGGLCRGLGLRGDTMMGGLEWMGRFWCSELGVGGAWGSLGRNFENIVLVDVDENESGSGPYGDKRTGGG